MIEPRRTYLPPRPPHGGHTCLVTVLSASAFGALAEHMAGPSLAFAFATLIARMAGEQIGRRWP